MKKLVLSIFISLLAAGSWAQTSDLRRKIEVSGSAETEVTPDIIYLAVSLKEYIDNKKKISIEELERQLQSAVLKAGIPKENFTINNISAYNYSWDRKKNPDFLASKQYRIKVSDLTKWNQIVNAVDAKAIQYSNVESYDYSKMDELKRDLKIKALKAARDKAIYLAESIGEKVGLAIEINESGNEYYPQPMLRNQVLMKTDGMTDTPALPDIDFKKIKLSYQMRAVFELK